MKIDRIQKRAIADLPEHVRLETQLPATLIHNDFNPRNVALRRGDDTLRLCAYDWELARPGLPQHDLAEFLCFVLPANVDRADVLAFVEFHRIELERASGLTIPADGWLLGFRLSLVDLLLNRFAMYVMAHRLRRQGFLPRVMKTWASLYRMFE